MIIFSIKNVLTSYQLFYDYLKIFTVIIWDNLNNNSKNKIISIYGDNLINELVEYSLETDISKYEFINSKSDKYLKIFESFVLKLNSRNQIVEDIRNKCINEYNKLDSSKIQENDSDIFLKILTKVFNNEKEN